MRIATWNVNGIRARLEFVLHWLHSRAPDVVAIQELKTADEQFPHQAFESAGYHASVYGQSAWNGVAVLSRTPPLSRAEGLAGREEDGARFLTVDLGHLLVATAYVPNGKSVTHPDFDRKLAWLDALTAVAVALDQRTPVIWGGDFNLCPGPLDSWNEAGFHGRIFHTDAERSRFQALLDAGLVDLFRAQNPTSQTFSWWDYRAGDFHNKRGLRIDFLLCSAPILARTREVVIDREYRKKKDGLIPSDHAPVYADLAD